MDAREIVKRIIMAGVVVGVTVLLLHPVIWVTCGWVIIKYLLILILAGIVARVIFKMSIKEIIFGKDKTNQDKDI